ncbi:low affinity Fe/Cu permease [Sphingomonas kaistensis]|uniref:Low affinity Fe/Cu permease n=1 Tax=Sphingomonas kaistensis TaxID=298708 RepID=A0A7X6BG34_9SPHN|nr:low affinity iron permease family protein [Sphingomonas kaistensis]NJC04612.1 low affinity Fe/Cu permease [Sphingomonas kaistensis]
MKGRKRSWLVQAGDRLSEAVARLFAHPIMHIVVIIFCCAWFAVGLPTDLLTAALSILAITLAQMVLNGQYDREAEAHRRDVAMHAKLDELIHATKRARDEMAGIEEELDEKEIRELREEAKELVEAAAKRTNDIADGERAKRAIEQVGDGR